MPKRPKVPDWDDVTPLPTGVSRGPKKGWYSVGLRKDGRQTVQGLDAAIALRAACEATRAAFLATDTDEKRIARNLARSGGNLAQERAFAQRLRVAFESLGWECHILNDFTLADILVRPRDGEDTWYWVQLKTTAERGSRDTWTFVDVSHYGRMLVVCHALKGPTRIPGTNDKFKPCTWVYNGETLTHHVPGGGLSVSPGKTNVWDDVAKGLLLAKCEADDLEACALETAALITTLLLQTPGYYPRTPKDEAEWTFESPAHFAEFASLYFLMQSAEASVCTVALPEAQQPLHDLEETCKATQEMLRLQAKTAQLRCRNVDGTASAIPMSSGLQVSLQKNIGDMKHGPYEPNDFDVLVVVWRDVLCHLWRVWRIPIGKITRNPPETGNLVTGITVHVPKDVPLPWGVDREVAHGPAPKMKGDGRRGEICKSYDWSTPYHTSYPMCDDWEPRVPWPDKLQHMRLNPLLVPTDEVSSEVHAPPDRPLKFIKLVKPTPPPPRMVSGKLTLAERKTLNDAFRRALARNA